MGGRAGGVRKGVAGEGGIGDCRREEMVGRGASWFKYKLDCLVHCYIVSNIFEVMPDLKKYKPLTKFHLFYAGIIFKTRFFPLLLYIILNKYI